MSLFAELGVVDAPFLRAVNVAVASPRRKLLLQTDLRRDFTLAARLGHRLSIHFCLLYI